MHELFHLRPLTAFYQLQLSLGDVDMTRNHVKGAVKMVELNGGPQTLGLDGFLEHLLSTFVGDVGLQDQFSYRAIA